MNAVEEMNSWRIARLSWWSRPGLVRVFYFYFREYERHFASDDGGPILEELLAGLASVQFEPVFVNAQVGVTAASDAARSPFRPLSCRQRPIRMAQDVYWRSRET
jgi:hypothetical protein